MSCCVEFNNSSIRWHVAHVLAQRVRWLTLSCQCKSKSTLGGKIQVSVWWPKQLRPFQDTIPNVKILCPWIEPHDICQRLGISTYGTNPQSKGREIRAFTNRATFRLWPIICNLHEGMTQIIYCRFIHASHLVARSLYPFIMNSLCKVAHWQFCTLE